MIARFPTALLITLLIGAEQGMDALRLRPTTWTPRSAVAALRAFWAGSPLRPERCP